MRPIGLALAFGLAVGLLASRPAAAAAPATAPSAPAAPPAPSVPPAPRGAKVPVREEAVHDVAAQLRCVVCQSLSVADSPSEIAHEMKDIIRGAPGRGREPRAGALRDVRRGAAHRA